MFVKENPDRKKKKKKKGNLETFTSLFTFGRKYATTPYAWFDESAKKCNSAVSVCVYTIISASKNTRYES